MDNENILAWNVVNWASVVLMVAIFFFLSGILQKWIQQERQRNAVNRPVSSNNMQTAR